MNKEAVALGADSAATLDGHAKTFETNKLFELSRQHPVGIMVYQFGSFLGTPWEVIIKAYRTACGSECQDRLEGYLTRFIKFVEERFAATNKAQAQHLVGLAKGVLDRFGAVASVAEFEVALDSEPRFIHPMRG